MKKPTFKDYIICYTVAAFIGGSLAAIFDPFTLIFWVFDLPLVGAVCWFFLWREPKKLDYETCENKFCSRPRTEENEWCEKHQLRFD